MYRAKMYVSSGLSLICAENQSVLPAVNEDDDPSSATVVGKNETTQLGNF